MVQVIARKRGRRRSTQPAKPGVQQYALIGLALLFAVTIVAYFLTS
jgi:hypothetical protein